MVSEDTQEKAQHRRQGSVLGSFGRSSRRLQGSLRESFGRNSMNSMRMIGRVFSKHQLDEGEWKCAHCTFVNRNNEFLSCEICGCVRAVDDSVKPNEHDSTSVAEDQKGYTKTEAPDSVKPNEHDLTSVSEDQKEYTKTEASCDEKQLEVKRLEDRMAEIVEAQRELYDELREKRVCRESLVRLKVTEQSIRALQDAIKESDGQETPTVRVSAENRKLPTKQSEDINTLRNGFSLSLPTSRKQIHHNPVETMKVNPWENDLIAINDIRECQDELWKRINSDPEPAQQKKQNPLRRLFLRRNRT
mmetsp:Transcript_5218/g.6817  ORF Transcript_5218/g.6817 Transcript_5218/m.6817 type:complete len:303 (-) Transcript_5218:113-1021(-)